MKQSLLRRNGFWLILSLVLILVSAFGASLVQTVGGSVTIKDLKWETSSGRAISALLFKPAGATDEAPAPAVVVSHGWWNNREMQDANYVELARRGYVVVSIDMYGHGNSDALPADELQVGGTGMYDAVKLVAELPYVDHDRIGVSGHSNGARAANFAVAIDNEAEKPLISSVFLVDNEAMYTDKDKAFANNYGTRDVGLVADQYDEFFFRSYGETVTPPREFATTANAQSFLYFGEEPGAEVREPGQYYTQDIDGVEAIRVLYTPPQTHPWGTISSGTVADQLDFFEASFGAPQAIDSHAQVWQLKEAFTTIGLVGFGIFLVAFARALLALRPFTRLRLEQAPAMVDPGRTGRIWFWGGLVVSALVSGASYIWLSQAEWLSSIAYSGSPEVPQGAVFFIAFWAAVNGVAGLIIMGVSYLAFGRKNGVDLRTSGVLPGWRNLGLGVLLALVTTAAAFAIVFLVDYFFKTDFRLWVLAVKWFSPDKIGYALFVLPLFLIYFVANSIALNSFNRFAIAGREWVNTAVLALFNSLAPIVLVVVQYVTFASSGELVPGFGGIFSIWLFPVIVILAVAAVISRKLYRATGNPYIAGVLNAAVVALVSASNSLVLTY
jgi:pimeloyl-ACP methyl ester carboxylesterase